MTFTTLKPTDKEKFNRFVSEHQSGSFLQSWGWGQWQEQLGQKALRFFVEDHGQILLAAQAVQTATPFSKKRYLYIPYGPLVAESEQGQEALQYFLGQLKGAYPDNLFIRLEPKDWLNLSGQSTRRIQPGKSSIVDLKLTQEELLANMHPKTRYNIKVAQKHGVSVIAEPIVTPQHGLYLQEVVQLLVTTAGRQGFKSQKAAYYQKMIDFFSMQAAGTETQVAIYRAVLGKDLLAAAIMVDFGTTRTYLFGGTTDKQKNTMAPYALHWQAMRDAQDKQFLSYDLWGTETSSGKVPGFVRFKLGWGGGPVEYPPVVDIVQRRTWYTIYKALRFINRIVK